MTRSACLTFDLQALSHNLSIVRQHAASSHVMAVIKANAYGHGVMQVARALEQADAFAVACVEEGLTLRQQGIKKEIVILQGFQDQQQLLTCVENHFVPVIHQRTQLGLLENIQLNEPLIIWLKVDTGMHRLGLNPADFLTAHQQLSQNKNIAEIRLMSHFANADNPSSIDNQQQLDAFESSVKLLPEEALNAPLSMANSAAILTFKESHYDWVRPGLMLYGVSAVAKHVADQFQLKPVMRLSTKVIAVNKVKQGESVGYGSQWTAKSDTSIAVCAIGYADGYPRHAVNGTPVWINQKQYPLAGRVSMDMICVDTGLDSNIKTGDEVVLWGPELAVELVAEHADTIAYELLCHAGMAG